MSKRIVDALAGAAMVLALSCGSDDTSGGNEVSESNQALCGKVCDKAAMCAPGTDAAQCKQSCVATAGTQFCRNQSAIVSALEACLANACDGYSGCVKALPACEGSTGTGGAAGTGGMGGGGGGAGGSGGGAGMGGSGGQTGGGGCEACVKFDACCTATIGAQGAAQICMMAAACNAAPPDQRGQYAQVCQMTLMAFSSQPNAAPACK